MTLLNGLLAFGASAFAIPLIIHLIHRNRYQTIDWGAMHFLRSSPDHNSRRLQWKQLLLLLLRCTIPVLLAMAMARPLLRSFLSSDGSSAMSLAIILDDSTSMFVVDQKSPQPDKSTRFSVACQSAVEILDGLPAGSNAVVVLGGSIPETLAGQMPAELALKLAEVSERSIPAGELDWTESIRSSLEWLATSSHAKRQLILISDFQKHAWVDSMAARIPETKRLIASQSIPPKIAFVNVSPSDSSIVSSASPNLSVDAISTSLVPLSVGCDSWISAKVVNHGNLNCNSVRVAVFANDLEIERQDVPVAAGSTNLVRCRWSPLLAGSYVIRANILNEDDLMADNSLSTVAEVIETFPILLVDGDRRSEAMESETDFLRLALSPFSLLSGKKGDAFLSKTIQPIELTESLFADYQAICLCNVREVTEVQQKWLYDYVARGNGLVVFLGDQVRSDQYQTWNSLANRGLRIANYAARTKIKSDANETSGRLQLQGIDFSPIRDLASVSLASLANVRFEHRIPIELDPTALSSSSDAWVAMRFEDDQAWILESRIGKGRCLWVGSSCDDDDSNLPARSVFVPLVQRLASYVCNSAPEPSNNLTAGDDWNRLVDKPTTNGTPVKRMQVLRPDGKVVEVSLSEDGYMRFRDTRLLGAYVAKQQNKEITASTGNELKNRFPNQFVACVSSRDSDSGKESQLAYLSTEEWSKLAVTFDAILSTGAVDLLNSTRSDWHGQEVWTWVWSVLVLCFLAEMAFEQSFSPKTRSKRTVVEGKAIQGKVA